MKQRQFLTVVEETDAHRAFDGACAHLTPRRETIPLSDARGRVLASDIVARVDVPGFDRSNVDGYAVRAADTYGAEELEPVSLDVAEISLAAGDIPPEDFETPAGTAVPIATGGVVPRGTDAVVMVEHTEISDRRVAIGRSVAPGTDVTFAGSDIGRGDTVLRKGSTLTSRDTAVLAAVGTDDVEVIARPRVAILSTGDELVSPGGALTTGQVYDSNQPMLLDAVAELGCEGVPAGIAPDNLDAVESILESLLTGPEAVDVILLSGGTSKGEGDVNSAAVERLADRLPNSPGIVVHGVALKPGKPILLSVVGGKPVVVLPGFPTSAVFTFHEFVAPLLRRLSGLPADAVNTVQAIAPMRITSVPGRTEYSLVDLVEGDGDLAAYPLGAGSGSVTAFGRADGFIRTPAATEYVEAGAPVTVRLLDAKTRTPDLLVIGSHCVGLDYLVGLLTDEGFRVKAIPVGSTAGLAALARGEGDVAGTHLLDPDTGRYNESFVSGGVRLVDGYDRRQGIVFRSDDAGLVDLEGNALIDALRTGKHRMVNRNPGSGTRILIDDLLDGSRPPGYLHQVKTHNGAAAAVEQGRADWGVTLDTVAAGANLEFRFVANERYDFAVREDRWDRPAVAALRRLLSDEQVRSDLAEIGFR
ncbi:MAG: molybdopterin biosynthesis protein [Actinomycetota bacterium]